MPWNPLSMSFPESFEPRFHGCLTRIRTCKESRKDGPSQVGDALPCAPPQENVQEIAEIATAWPCLSAPLRAAVLAIVRSVQSVQEVRP